MNTRLKYLFSKRLFIICSGSVTCGVMIRVDKGFSLNHCAQRSVACVLIVSHLHHQGTKIMKTKGNKNYDVFANAGSVCMF